MTNYCSSCGAPLAQGMTRCPVCGASLIAAAMPSSLYDDTPYIESAPFNASSSFAAAPTESGLPNMPAAPGGAYSPVYSQPLPQGTAPLPYPGQPGVPGSYPAAYSQPLPPRAPLPYPGQPSAPPRRRFSVVIVALLSVLIIAVLVGSALTYYALVKHPANSQTAAKASPTATTGAHKTPLNTSNPQALYTQVMGRTPSIDGALSNQNIYQWLAEPNNAGCTPAGSGLHLTLSSGQAAFCLAQNTHFSDFAFQVQTTINQGLIGGIIFRADILGRKIYFMGVANQGGIYEIASVVSTSGGQVNPKLLGGGVSTAINTESGKPNTIAVIAIGSTLDFYINRQFVTTVQDSSSLAGAIGLVGANGGQGNVDVGFANAMIWDLTQ